VLATPMSGEAYTFAMSRDGSVIARAEGGAATLWHRSRPLESRRLGSRGDVRYVDVSPDGRRVATSGNSRAEVNVWDAENGLVERQLPVGPGSGVKFSPDGRWLVTNGRDFRFWKVGTWDSKGLSDRIFSDEGGSYEFSPDSTLIAIQINTAVVLVEVATGREVARLEAPGKEHLVRLRFCPDGSKLVGPADFQSVHLWDLRALRRELSAIGLDWDLPPYPPAPETTTGPIRIEIDPGPAGIADGRPPR
jgi:WD40 repeat protein